ncbi:putative potassium channel, voltage-dependent, EAG/ELK/ERG [Rosa chinensis]|uniref:Putative potassium channel, voltage-dependent, EAG/ELK/ERG n=1 Tax=Rosa chinensis TaxID=74649 RepID=A0A2P6PPF4_ROSCH|nr:putative potassium channel, voltage-dependent, EAG/ELK/ERG [Rosa chinensis]
MKDHQDPNSSNFLFLTSLQYTLRIYYIYGSLERRPIIDITRAERWLRPILGFVPFILASHLFGAFWYLLATQRQIQCWVSTRNQINPIVGPNKTVIYITSSSSMGYVACGTQHNLTYPPEYNISLWDDLCPVNKDADPKIFDFGIYLYPLQSDVASSSNHLLERVFQSFWWALRNLRLAYTRLHTSFVFSIFFFQTRYRLTLCLSVFFFQFFWFKPNQQYGYVRNFLLYFDIYKWHGAVFSISQCKSAVPVLQTIDEKVLKEICQHLVPVTYAEDNYIVQEGKPLGKMLLFTQGSAVTYSHGGTSSGSSSNKWLKKGDFYGDELLNWAFKSPSYPDLPISNRNVIAQEKVEAFAIRASDLKSIFFKFWWFFSREVHASQLEQWEHLAASSIQATWRNRQARIRLVTSYIQPTSWLRRRAKSTSPTNWNRLIYDKCKDYLPPLKSNKCFLMNKLVLLFNKSV